jgi:hypothetical protein
MQVQKRLISVPASFDCSCFLSSLTNQYLIGYCTSMTFHSSGSSILLFYCISADSILGQPMWDLWSARWHWGTEYFTFTLPTIILPMFHNYLSQSVINNHIITTLVLRHGFKSDPAKFRVMEPRKLTNQPTNQSIN